MNNRNSQSAFLAVVLLFFFFSAPQARTRWEKSIDTFSVQMTKNHFDSAVARWRIKVNARQLSCTAHECDTLPPFYSTGILRTGLFTKAVKTDSGYLKISLTHVWSSDNRKYSLYRIPNVTYTLKQELEAANNDGVIVPEKNYWAFAGLTLLNSGAGLAYAHYKSPLGPENVFIIVYDAIVDAALTAGLFSTNWRIHGFCAIFLPAIKLSTGIHFISVRDHNKYSRTGYKFILGK